MTSSHENGQWEPREWEPQEWALDQEWQPSSWDFHSPAIGQAHGITPESTPVPEAPMPPEKVDAPQNPEPTPPAAQAAPPTGTNPEHPTTGSTTPAPPRNAQRAARPVPKPRQSAPHGPAPLREELAPESDLTDTFLDPEPELHVPPPHWLPTTSPAGWRPRSGSRNASPLAFVIVGIAAVFILGQVLSSWNSVDSYGIDPFLDGEVEPWDPGGEPIGYLDPPDGYQEDVVVGPVWLPVPDGWEHNLVTTDTGGEQLRLTPPDSSGAQFRYAWESEGEFSEADELCFSTLAGLTAGAPDAAVDDSIRGFSGIADVEAVICSATATRNETLTDYQVTAFLDSSAATSLVAISQRHAEAAVDEGIDAWDRYLTCSVGEQLGITLDDCV